MEISDMNFQENTSSGSRDTAVKTYSSPSKAPLLFGQSQTDLHRF